jgi:hypothetical protein
MNFIEEHSVVFMNRLIQENSDVVINDNYYSLFLAKINIIESQIEFNNKEYILTNEDKLKILQFINNKERKYYSYSFFRIDLSEYILLFELYYNYGTFYMIGHMITNNYISKWNLTNARSKIDYVFVKQQVALCLQH